MRADYVLEHGGTLYAADNKGKVIDPYNKTFQAKNRPKLISLYKKGIKTFLFQPAEIGLIALFLKGDQGVEKYYNIVQKDKFMNADDKQASYSPEFINASMFTPSGVILFFEKPKKLEFKNCTIAPGIIVYYNRLIPIPGSTNETGYYSLFQDELLLNPLPEIFINLIPYRKTSTAIEADKVFYNYNNYKEKIKAITSVTA